MIASHPLRWAVLITDLEPIRGHEQGGARRVLVVSYEAFHRSASMTVCPITAARSTVRYPNEVAIPAGEAGQTKAGVILCHQVRTVSMLRVVGRPEPVGYLTDPSLREQIRMALARHMGLDIPARTDGALGTRAFGQDRLLRLLLALDKDVSIVIAPKHAERGHISVQAS